MASTVKDMGYYVFVGVGEVSTDNELWSKMEDCFNELGYGDEFISIAREVGRIQAVTGKTKSQVWGERKSSSYDENTVLRETGIKSAKVGLHDEYTKFSGDPDACHNTVIVAIDYVINLMRNGGDAAILDTAGPAAEKPQAANTAATQQDVETAKQQQDATMSKMKELEARFAKVFSDESIKVLNERLHSVVGNNVAIAEGVILFAEEVMAMNDTQLEQSIINLVWFLRRSIIATDRSAAASVAEMCGMNFSNMTNGNGVPVMTTPFTMNS